MCVIDVNEADCSLCFLSLRSVVWSILVLELIFEGLIRPSNYYQLRFSDKGYAPSTARYINTFHLVTEGIALALFVPEFSCLATRQCGARVPASGVDAALSAVLGPARSDGALGRLTIGLTSLRIVGLVRHWKIMWINRTFKDNNVGLGEKPTFVEVVQVKSTSAIRSRIGRNSSIQSVSCCRFRLLSLF
jgi:hypothetical protein